MTYLFLVSSYSFALTFVWIHVEQRKMFFSLYIHEQSAQLGNVQEPSL